MTIHFGKRVKIPQKVMKVCPRSRNQAFWVCDNVAIFVRYYQINSKAQNNECIHFIMYIFT